MNLFFLNENRRPGSIGEALWIKESETMPNVIVVDDSATVRNQVIEFLNKNDIAADFAIDGQDAYDKLTANGDDYKLAIVDVNMPNMDGLTLAEKVKSDLNLPELNIIMLTTEFEAKLKERGKNAGVKGWIVKPFNGDKVIGSIKKMLG